MAGGILPYQHLLALVRAGTIAADLGVHADQVQPASVDLRLGRFAYRVPASFLPGPRATVMERINQFGQYEIDLARSAGGAVLERGCVYIVPLQERLVLQGELSGIANPKSSVGRLDVFTRLITDRGQAFDRVEPGYHGPLYVEIAPRTFSVVVREGTRLNQLRLRRGAPFIDESALRRLHAEVGLVDRRETIREDHLGVTIDLSGDGRDGLVGWRAKKHSDVIDIDRVGHYDPHDYWERVESRFGRPIILNPDDFYILATREAVRVPPDHAAEMVAYDTMVGEFRVHYAGFFDPGFGWDVSRGGSRAVLEVRSHEVPFALEHEQVVGWLRYERLAEVPEKLYGPAIGSSYQYQGLALAKQFRAP